MELNSKKTEVILVGKKNECPQINIFIKATGLKQSDLFKYISTLISCGGRNKTDPASRTEQTKKIFPKMKSILAL